MQTRLFPHIRTFIKDGLGVYNIAIIKKLYEKNIEYMILQYFGRGTFNAQNSVMKMTDYMQHLLLKNTVT